MAVSVSEQESRRNRGRYSALFPAVSSGTRSSMCRDPKDTIVSCGFKLNWFLYPDSAQGRYETPGPPVDVVFFEFGMHSLHPFFPIGVRHGHCLINCIRHLIDIVWIDDESILQFARRAGKLAEDEDSIVVVT